jgi:protein-disulfide isomerase
MEENQKNYTIPIAIVIAGLFIAGALVLNNWMNRERTTPIVVEGNVLNPVQGKQIPKIGLGDYIIGSPDASIIIVEYSDLECPYCRIFHITMKRVMNEYLSSGKVAWIYRHLVFEGLHPKAIREAQAAECVAELAGGGTEGNQRFWQYIDRIFDITPSGNGLDLNLLPEVAQELGIDRASFETCLTSDKYEEKVKRQSQDAIDAGATGTPYNFMITTIDGKQYPIEGAATYEEMKDRINLIDNYLLNTSLNQ